MRRSFLFVITSFAMVVNVSAAMRSGTPDIRSLGSLAFGPDGVLLIGDSVSGILFAVDLNDRTPNGEAAGLEVTDIDEKLAANARDNGETRSHSRSRGQSDFAEYLSDRFAWPW